MTDKQRTFLLGAGFSKAVADGPLMKEIWEYIVKAYENEKNIKVSTNDVSLRQEWYDELEKFMIELETEIKLRFTRSRFDEIKVLIRENIEYLFTLIDLNLAGPKVEFKKEGVDVTPYPAIFLRFTGRDRLKNIRRSLITFLYIILINLKENDLASEFVKIITEKDQIITFNYDLVLEKTLWNGNIWSPLDGYAGVVRFKDENDRKKLEESNRYSRLKIHKIHGSICWTKPDKILDSHEHLSIELDNIENWGFHFDGLKDILGREPISASLSERYEGGHDPTWMLPSFIKPFEYKEFYEIWKSALKAMSKTDELVIIGYSFRPEDSSAQLLISSLPDGCNITLVDPKPENIKERLDRMGLKVNNTYKLLEEYLS